MKLEKRKIVTKTFHMRGHVRGDTREFLIGCFILRTTNGVGTCYLQMI